MIMKLSEVNLDINPLTDDQLNDVVFGGVESKAVPSDAAIVLGTSPEGAKKRMRFASAWFTKTNCKKIVLSGGVCHDGLSESEFMLQTGLHLGMPSEIFIREENSRNTIGNMICSLNKLYLQDDVSKIRTVTVITEPFHLKRSLMLAKIFFPSYWKINGYAGEINQIVKISEERELRENEALYIQELIHADMIGDLYFNQ